jgi:uncharacterized protein YceK
MNAAKLLVIAVALAIVVVLAGCGGTHAQRAPASGERGATVVRWQDTTTGFYHPVLEYNRASGE